MPRIPLHDHLDNNSGGRLARSSIGVVQTTSTGAGSGASSAITDHGGLSGLDDDDHPQYATNVEFDDHSARHESGGADAIKLDDLATPDDNTDLDATTGHHGLLPKLPGGTTTFLRADGSWAAPPGGGSGDASGQFIVGWDGGGSALTSGAKQDIVAPFTGTIAGWTLLADTTGSAVVDIWKDTYANFPPTVGDTITASAKPTLSSASKATSTTLTGWTTAVTAGDVLRFNLDSVSTIKKLLIVVDYTRP